MSGHQRSLKMSAIIIALHLIMVACSTPVRKEKPQWQPATIADFKSVAGTWEGLMIRTPRNPTDDWVTIVIRESGSYQFASVRLIGVFGGQGKLTLAEGKLTETSDKGARLTLQLFRDPRSNERMLKADGRDDKGYTYVAELKRTGGVSSVPK